MNVEEFTKKNLLERQRMNIEELSIYYKELRKYEFESGVPLKNIELRRKIHPLLVEIIKIDRLLTKETIKIVADRRVETNRPKIYACTHIGGNDIQRVFEAIQEHAYLFLGDPKGLYKDLSGLLLYLNGVISCETDDKEDKRIAKERSIELLNKGGNLLIFPEGAWNIFSNLPLMKIYKGAVDMARITGADIIPTAIEQYDNQFYISIGKNIRSEYLDKFSREEANTILRDAMATQKWNIFRKQRADNVLETREQIITMTHEEYKQAIVDKCDYDFTVNDVERTMYKDPNEIPIEEYTKYYLTKKYLPKDVA